MGKEKELKSSKEPKTANTNEIETIPNPNFFFGTDEFMLENGDMYGGKYCCHKTGIVWREGEGIYITKDRHIYQGQWENDQLLNSTNSSVRYPTGEEYWGSIINGKYNGYGTYTLDNKLRITCDFAQNIPVGQVTLTDYEGHLWKGVAEEDKVILLRENHYFQAIPSYRGIGKYVKVTQKIDENIEAESLPDKKVTEDMVFKTSNKTYNDFIDMNTLFSTRQFKDSNITQNDDVIPSEQSSHVSVSLLKKFLSKEYRKQNVPLPVFSPQSIVAGMNNECKQEEVLQTEG